MPLDVEMLTVGQIAENCFLFRKEGSEKALIVDPGEEPERILAAVQEMGVSVEAILLTHCHFDHIGAVAPVAKTTGAPVYCPEIEVPILADIMAFVPWEGFGPYESYQADHTVRGGETLELGDWSWTSSTHPATARATSPIRCAERTRSSPATSSSRDRWDAWTCPAATGRR